jgi:hypothetical protein
LLALLAALGAGLGLGMGGCAIWPKPASLPSRGEVVRDQLVIHSDFELPKHHRLLDEVAAERGDVAANLRLPLSDEPIHVYLFEDDERYREFVARHYPDLQERRAFFVENDTQLSVYAYWGDRVAEDLRHEVAHGYLHSTLPHLPLWLDEGLAEYFEVPRGRRGLNRPHVDLLLAQFRADRWVPNLPRLERLSHAAELSQMDYAESWAWVHFLLESTPERREMLQAHLSRLRTTGTVGPLSEEVRRMDFAPERMLLRHLELVSQE